MDIGRDCKRRKTDRSTPENPSKQSSCKTPSFHVRRPGPVPEKTQSAQEVWAVAKASRQSNKYGSQGKTEADLYDDIDGAHPSLPQKAVSERKRKAPLDPLRNQREQPASSPVNTASVRRQKSLGFFKQFHTPKTATASGEQNPLPEIANERHDTPLDQVEVGEASVQGDYEQAVGPRRHSRRAADAPTPAPRRRKTFEDEIRDLEAAAKREVEADGTEGTPEASAAQRRSLSRRSKVTLAFHDGPGGVTNTEVKVQKKHDVAAERAEPVLNASRPTRQPFAVQQGAASDAMEIADSDNETIVKTAEPRQPAKSRSKPVQRSKASLSTKALSIAPTEISAIQPIVLERLTGKRPVPLTNLDDEETKVRSVVCQTITAGESNSMLLIGARGTGKTALVNHILRQQAVQHPDVFHVVRLNGFIHTDDKIALREIWRQLGRDMEGEGEETTAKNYADTLTTLLALLSHPSEQGRHDAEGVSKSVIFILDEFDLFASHPRQTLLYNLFDIAQSRKAPILVLGLTTKIDVSEALEKRVKSRFSHRNVHLSAAKSFMAFQQTCKAVLSVSEQDIPEAAESSRSALAAWDSMIDATMQDEKCASYLERLFYTTRSIPEFMSSMMLPVAWLPQADPLDLDTFKLHLLACFAASQPPDSKLSLLPSLSTLRLALLVCAARLTNIYHTDNVTFALVYEEYKILASKAKLQQTTGGHIRVSSKEVARGAWGGLLDCGLIMRDGRAGGGGRVDVGLEEIGWYSAQTGLDMGQWARWCREI